MAPFRSITDFQQLGVNAYKMRQWILRAIHKAQSGHPGGSLGMADIFSVLFFNAMRHDPKNPKWEKRDRLVLSNGHICPILYCAMSFTGYFPQEELMTLRQCGSRLQGHPHRLALPGLETSSGPLGSGLSQAAGMALAAKRSGQKQNHSVFVLTSDGEHQEGNTWEAVLFAAKYKLDNLIQIMDRNNIQIDGTTEEVMPLDSLQKKYEAFGWFVKEIDGHNYQAIINAIRDGREMTEKPTLILAKTTPGKGVSFMENNFHWHGTAPNDDQLVHALKELQDTQKSIESGAIQLTPKVKIRRRRKEEISPEKLFFYDIHSRKKSA